MKVFFSPHTNHINNSTSLNNEKYWHIIITGPKKISEVKTFELEDIQNVEHIMWSIIWLQEIPEAHVDLDKMTLIHIHYISSDNKQLLCQVSVLHYKTVAQKQSKIERQIGRLIDRQTWMFLYICHLPFVCSFCYVLNSFARCLRV